MNPDTPGLPPAAAPALIVVGASQGGVHAVSELLRRLPADFGIPVAIALHRERASDAVLSRVLERSCGRAVEEATDKAPLAAGRILVAPADYHLLIERGHVALSTDAPVRYSRPSIDVLFESAADVYGAALTAVVLTGANDDGARGSAAVAARAGSVLIQTPDTAECPVMPQAALAAVPGARSGPIAQLATWLSTAPQTTTTS